MDVLSLLFTLMPLLLAILIMVLVIWVWYLAARNMARIAADKGYFERKWFHYCFWLGLIGFLMVCAMPDKSHENPEERFDKYRY